MRIPTKNILAVKKYMLDKRCLVVEATPKGNHPVLNIPNLQVLSLMQSFVAKKYVKKTFCWRYGYYFLEDAAVEIIKNQLWIADNEMVGTYTANTAVSEAKILN